MTILEDLIPRGTGARPGYQLTRLKGLVVHWIGASQPRASVIRSNFARSVTGTHYVIDHNDGTIIHCVPDDEVCYHVGASAGFSYTDTKRAICGDNNPNWYLVGIECCISAADKIPDDYAAYGKYMELGRPSAAQYEALVEFCADFLHRHGLTVEQLYLHNDITTKTCHVWFVKDRARWAQFKARVADRLEDLTMTPERFKEMLDEIDPVYQTLEDVPDYWRADVKRLMEAGAIRGDGVNKVAKRRSVLEAAIVAMRYTEREAEQK